MGDLGKYVFFFQRALRSHLLSDRRDLYAKMRTSGHGCAFCGPTISDYIHGSRDAQKKIPNMNGNRHIAAVALLDERPG